MHAIADPNASSGTGLDPEDWSAFRALGHRMVDDMVTRLERIRDEPVWRAVPPETIKRLTAAAVPLAGVGPEQAYEDFLRDVFPYPVGNIHPRFWGWVIGSGTPIGALSEMLAATMNPNVSGLQGSARYVEAQVITWLGTMLGYPGTGRPAGLMVSGASMANLAGIAAGLQARGGFDVGRLGLARAPKPPVLYTSDQAHFSVGKAARLLGIGSDALRIIPTDSGYRMDLDALRRIMVADRAEGMHPFCVVGGAGTVNTGATDDLEALADLALAEGLWFHVDGAFGAFAALDPELLPLVRGMERADSLAFDLHKWMVVPIEAGVVLVRDEHALRGAFDADAGYVSSMPGGIGHDAMSYAALGVELTRGFRALKVWMSLKAHGTEAYGALVRRNVEQARYLARRVAEEVELELVAPAPLNVVVFRYVRPGLPDQEQDRLNRSILVGLQEDGVAAPSQAVLRGRFALRVCLVNHRTRQEDLDVLVAETLARGRGFVAEAVNVS